MNYMIPTKVNGTIMMREMENFVDSFFGGYTNNDTTINYRTPVVDILNLDKEYTLTAELPGISEKDINIKVEDNLLTISTVVEEENLEKEKNWLIKERKNSGFKRSFYLPKDADVKKINASFSEGLLKLNIEKKEEAKPFNIKVNK